MLNASYRIHVIYIETDPSARRAVELYVRGFTSEGLELHPIASSDDIRKIDPNQADLVVVEQGDDPPKRELLEKIHARFGHVPVLELGDSGGGMINTGGVTTLDEYLPKVKVSASAILRSIGNLVARRRLERKIEEMEQSMKEVCNRDPLTGLWNRQYLIDRLAEEFDGWQRYRYPVTLCLIEIANQDRIEELYSFEVADGVLKSVGEMICAAKRTTDFAGRFDKALFCAAFPKTPIGSALVPIQRLHGQIKEAMFSGKASENFTVDARYAVVQLCESHETAGGWLDHARHALRTAHAGQPHQIVVAKNEHHPAAGRSVLAVAHRAEALEDCRHAYEAEGYRVDAAGTGREALAALEQRRFDLYLLDLEMPDIDGRDLVRKIQGMHSGKPAQIIGLVGEGESGGTDWKSLGVARLLKQPFQRETALALGRDLLRQHAPEPEREPLSA